MLAGATIDKCKCKLYRLVYICVPPYKSGSYGASLCNHSFISMQSVYICQRLQVQLSTCNFHLSMLAGATIRLPFTFVNGLPSHWPAAAAPQGQPLASCRCPTGAAVGKLPLPHRGSRWPAAAAQP